MLNAIAATLVTAELRTIGRSFAEQDAIVLGAEAQQADDVKQVSRIAYQFDFGRINIAQKTVM